MPQGETKELALPFRPEKTTTTRLHKKLRNPGRMQKGFWENRYVPLRTKIAGLAAGAVLTVFGGDKIVDQVFPDTTAQNPAMTLKIEPSAPGEKIVDLRIQANNYIFSNLTSQEAIAVEREVQEMDRVIINNPSFKDMVRVVKDNEAYITAAAAKYKIPLPVAFGMVLIENGGGQSMVSPAGAAGPAQLMRDAAIEMGLRVDPSTGSGQGVDERLDPKKAFDAMCGYLAKYRDYFGGDLGISVWNYHAGPGNVGEAIRLYFLDTEGVDIGPLNQGVYAKKIVESKLNVYRLLANHRVSQQLISRLEDETELYPAKAASGGFLYPLYKAVR